MPKASRVRISGLCECDGFGAGGGCVGGLRDWFLVMGGGRGWRGAEVEESLRG